jgi:excisionase family DNA binding protein
MTDRSKDDFVTAAEACELLNVKPATLYTYVSRGLVQSYRQGKRRQRLYRRSELNALRCMQDGPVEHEEVNLPDAASWVGER